MNKRIFKKRVRQSLYPQLIYLFEEYSLNDILHSKGKSPVNRFDPMTQYLINKKNHKVVLNVITSRKEADKGLIHLYHYLHQPIFYVMYPNDNNKVELTTKANTCFKQMFHHLKFNTLYCLTRIAWSLNKQRFSKSAKKRSK